MRKNKPTALLLHPPVYDFALFDLFLKPYGLFRIAAALEEAGYEVRYVNALDYHDPPTAQKLTRPKRRKNGTGKFFRSVVEMPERLSAGKQEGIHRSFARYGILHSSLREKIAAVPADIVFLSTGMTYWYPGAAEAAALVHELHPGVPLVAGGVYAALMPDHCREQTQADIIARLDRGTLKALLESVGLPSVPGSGELPDPAVNPAYWGEAGILRLNEGCPCSCEYCSSRSLSPSFRSGEPQKAFDRLSRLWASGIRHFAFYDDALLVNREQVLKPLLRMVIDSPLTPSFYTPNATHVSLYDAETAQLMKKAGFQEIRLGYESSSREFHDSYGAKYADGKFSETIELLKDAGFTSGEIGVYILAGLPEQHHEEVRDSIHQASSAGVKIYIAEFSPVPGSALWETCVQKSRLPLAEEPLFHNNTFFPMEWDGFSAAHLQGLKSQTKDLNKMLPARGK